MNEERQEQYFELIDKLVNCPNGKEPDVLDENIELVDAGFISALMEVGQAQIHHGNQDGAKFLFHVARELAKQLGFYPDPNASQVPAQ
ncbi:MAG: hypothetical protein O4803_12655 [Trichodesmium sp. St15_bin1_1]|jgi:hypothetical protein|nr:hypothetical protein [Trichodesmium sp. MAG_R02]MDE5074647.1 hypothetical protein [Trichodesmium sp. St5_bin2_1]MDE5082941.1 hypothetical protein [Trichodesmium sp. St18_bin1]MDE5088585.1 hypothetical protein [Trichodesmium sp. St16_bin2-tuft]MDE5109121.1 hypothetical protein [Trichodesmium sp. St17_bin3_1_1]MDE5110027.1 hypothetical protein [Trichodesmium sp. St7_bin2_1]MDE5115043.1 hypothetical protein [Trichodesmium sp. St15_bin1_1]MDE5118576.1 hypothetical protein [Trichodesmium sp. S